MFCDVTGGLFEMDQEIWLKHYFETGATISISKSTGYAIFNYKGKTYLLHRWIMDAKPGEQVAHLDGNKLNNKRSNLKICSQSENFRNLNDELRKDNTSGYRGVTCYKKYQKWIARIRGFDKKLIHLGYYDTPEEAHVAYQKAAERYGFTPKIVTF